MKILFDNRPATDPRVLRTRAAAAGSRGRSAAPMATGRRVAGYLKQTGRRDLTPRQRRQVARMAIRETVRAERGRA